MKQSYRFSYIVYLFVIIYLFSSYVILPYEKGEHSLEISGGANVYTGGSYPERIKNNNYAKPPFYDNVLYNPVILSSQELMFADNWGTLTYFNYNQNRLLYYYTRKNDSENTEFGGNLIQGLYEYGISRKIGMGIYLNQYKMKASIYHDYNILSYTNFLIYSNLATQPYLTYHYPTYTISYYHNSIDMMRTYITYYDSMQYEFNKPFLFSSAGLHISYHFLNSKKFDPYVRLYAGTGDMKIKKSKAASASLGLNSLNSVFDKKNESYPSIQSGVGTGLKYYPGKYFYIFSEATFLNYKIKTININDVELPREMAPRSGALNTAVIQFGVGYKFHKISSKNHAESDEKSNPKNSISPSEKSSPGIKVDTIYIEKDQKFLTQKKHLIEGLDELKRVINLEYYEIEKTVRLRMPNDVVFEPGSDVILPEGVNSLQKISTLLKSNEFKFRIEGHTDNQPTNSPKFPSNWELASARAISVVRLFMSDGVKEERMSAVSHGSNKPIASNLTARGRKKNRRIEMVIVLSADEKLPENLEKFKD